MSLVKDYFLKTEQYQKEYGEKTVVLMQVGAFFEIYGLKDIDGNITQSKLEEISLLCDLIIANKSNPAGSQKQDKQQVVMAGFRDHQIDKYLKKLQENGWTAVVFVQDSPTKNTTRSLLGVYSPGTLFISDSNQLSNYSICIWCQQSKSAIIGSKIHIGISAVDICTGKTFVFETTSDNRHTPSSYDELERISSIIKPSEVIFISNLEDKLVNDIIQFSGLENTSIRFINLNNKDDLSKKAKNSEKQQYQSEVLIKFFPDLNQDTLFLDFHDKVYATQSFVFLLDDIYSHNPNLTSKLLLPLFQVESNRLVLANHSLKQLNMISDKSNTRLSSVDNLLNQCVTALGKRIFQNKLLNPITNIDELENSYQITDYLLSNKLQQWQNYRVTLSKVRDIEKLGRKAILKRITPKDFAIMFESLNHILLLFNNVYSDKELWSYLNKNNVIEIDILCQILMDYIESNLNIELAKEIDTLNFAAYAAESVADGICFIKPGVDDNVDKKSKGGLDARDQVECIREWLDSIVKAYDAKAKSDLIKLHETPTMPPSLVTTKRRAAILEKEIDKMKKNSSLKQVYLTYKSRHSKCNESFTFDIENLQIIQVKSDMIISSPQIKELCDAMRNSKEALFDAITQYYSKFCEEFLNISQKLPIIAEFVSNMDILQCKCYIADKYNYCRPIIDNVSDKSFINIRGLRHPLIEHLQTKEIYVTNDISLGKNETGILLYGTNAVGKTSLIKAVGLSVIMAQAGLYVPCESFVFKPYEYLFTRILGNDNIHKGLSTFAVEMIELRTILKLANKNSLILGDELCSGTESDSALSIFAAGLEVLHNVGSSFIFATHFHEVASYSEVTNLDNLVMKHMTVTYDKANDLLIYDRKLKDGPGDSMYGLEVCKSLDLPQEFLNRAHEIRMKYNSQFEQTLSGKSSHFNAKKIKGNCELCGKKGEEVHHLQHQQNADEKGNIGSFHKNHLANLLVVCNECHDKIHNSGKQHKKVKTSKGYKLLEL